MELLHLITNLAINKIKEVYCMAIIDFLTDLAYHLLAFLVVFIAIIILNCRYYENLTIVFMNFFTSLKLWDLSRREIKNHSWTVQKGKSGNILEFREFSQVLLQRDLKAFGVKDFSLRSINLICFAWNQQPCLNIHEDEDSSIKVVSISGNICKILKCIFDPTINSFVLVIKLDLIYFEFEVMESIV